MSETPLVSVCIPTFNREKIIAHALESVMNQSYKNIEIIMSDNCSTDNTFEILKKYSEKDTRIKLFRMKENKGPIENWKNCFVNSSGKFIKYLWSDDYIDVDFIEKAVNALEDDIGFVYAPVKWYDVKSMKVHQNIGFKVASNSPLTVDFYIESLMLRGDAPVSGSCAMFRKNIIEDLFSSNIKNCLDLDYNINGAGFDALMFLYAVKQYKRFAYVDDSFAYYGVDSDGITVRDGQKLTPYYFSVFYDFLIAFKHEKQLLSKFKSRVLFYKLFHTTNQDTKSLLDKLLVIMAVKVDYSMLIKLVLKDYVITKTSNFIKKIIRKVFRK